jgi:hypothetical protein
MGGHLNATYYEDVRVPANALVGPGRRLVADRRPARHERVSPIGGTTEWFYEETRTGRGRRCCQTAGA